MQLAKVVIATVLVLAACAEGLPEGKGLMYYKYIHLSLSTIMYNGPPPT